MSSVVLSGVRGGSRLEVVEVGGCRRLSGCRGRSGGVDLVGGFVVVVVGPSGGRGLSVGG